MNIIFSVDKNDMGSIAPYLHMFNCAMAELGFNEESVIRGEDVIFPYMYFDWDGYMKTSEHRDGLSDFSFELYTAIGSIVWDGYKAARVDIDKIVAGVQDKHENFSNRWASVIGLTRR
jgi:hypothetical protein